LLEDLLGLVTRIEGDAVGNEVPRGNVIEMSNYCGKLPALACSPK
jgi:hypothetical protein